MIGSANGTRIGITGLGVNVPDRVVTNDDLARYVDTTDEWIVERTGIRERRMATEDEALTDIALPAARAALEDAGAAAADIDLLICATVTPDMMFPTSSALMADALGRRGCRRVRPARRVHRLHVRRRTGLRRCSRPASRAGRS